ncbi:MAG: PA14 domain-containing protein [Paracoccaceae bacterium]
MRITFAYKRKMQEVKATLLLVATALVLGASQASAQTTNDLLMTTYANVDFTGAPLTSGPVTTIDQINLDPTGRGDFYGVRIVGYIFADTTGTYSFETFSDDGVRLFVNASTVIDNYGLHAPTINTGTIDLVAGNWYPIQIDHYEWAGGQRLRLRWRTPGSAAFEFPAASALSQTLPVFAPPPPTDEDVAAVITEEATRALRAEIQANQRANQNARSRHAAALRCQALREAGESLEDQRECRDGLVSRESAPLSFTGNISANDAGAQIASKFFHQSGGHNGTARKLFFGDFSVSRFEGGDVSAVLSARYASERMVNDVLVGYFLGVTATHSDLSATVAGNRTGYGLSVGTYFVDQLGEKLTWDGFLSVGTGRNNLEINDGGGDINSDYSTSSILLGFALSGSKEYAAFELRPELSLTYGYTDIGNVALTGGTSAVVDAGGVTLGRISLEPDFIFTLDAAPSRFDEASLWITPSVTCEYQRTTTSDHECGGGLAFEWTAGSDNGQHDLSVRLSREVLGGETRDTIGLQLESAF